MKKRVLAASLALSASGLVGIAQHEGFTSRAVIPVQGDPYTIGFGSTFYPDGSRVKAGDTITPQRALYTMKEHIGKDETQFRESLPNVMLYQGEYDIYVDFVYQYGIYTWNRSSMRKQLLAGNYKAACDALLMYKYSGGYDCSTPGNRRCSGVWTRQLARHTACTSML